MRKLWQSLGIVASVFASAAGAGPAPGDGEQPRLTIGQLRAQYADAASRYVDVGGMRIHYKDEGKGPVLLMAHGSEGSLRTYDRIVAGLKREYRIIRFDVPGYGLSDGATADAAASALPTDVPAKLLATLRVKDVTCLGVSSGGTMCLYLAARHPQLVRRLILSNMPSDPVRTDHMVQPERFLAAQRRAAETGYRDRNFWDQFLSFFAGDPARISARTRLEYYDFNRRAVEPYPHAMVARIGDGIEARAMMRTVTAPTLLIWGGRDQLLPIAASDTLASYLPNVPLSRLIMPDVGHYPPLESPERFAALVRAYLEQALPER